MKFIIVPHTHWDREWYFTNEISDSLLKYNLDNFLNKNINIESYYLDGQVSLLDDYMNYANETNCKKLSKLIKQKKFIVGPLYSQPDVFNSLGETTLRNCAIADKVLKKFNFPKSKIFYCPDTFGFGFNFPQIIKHMGFKNFVFWRGLSKDYENSDFNEWVGIEGSKVNSYRFKYGYWKISSIFPWNDLNEKNIDLKVKEFLNNFENDASYVHFQKQAKITNGVVIIPFGGDQAPIHPLTTLFFEKLNKIATDEFKIGKFDDFFSLNNKPKSIVEKTIDFGYESKIHRTISSTRYDFKKLFRDIEVNLYHSLEPLEMVYKNIDRDYQINNDEVIKKLTCMQAHDVLGGCVTDDVFLASSQKLDDIQNIIEAKKNIIMKQISKEMNLEENSILIFNPNIGKDQNNFQTLKIYTSKPYGGFYSAKDFSVAAMNSKPYMGVEGSFETELIIFNKNIDNLFFTTFNLNLLNNKKTKEENFLDYKSFLNFKVIYDNGDLFDADPEEKKIIKTSTKVTLSKIHKFDDFSKIEIKGTLLIDEIKNDFHFEIYNSKEKFYVNFSILNNTKNVIVKWTPPIAKSKDWSYLQHLGISNYEFREIKNWKKLGYKEKPLNVQKNSGLIFNKNSFITTKGTNEFTLQDDYVEITLYRSCGVLGKKNLSTRPGVVSGIENHIIDTSLGQMINKELKFNFSFGKYKENVSNQLNNFYRKILVLHPGSKNLIYSFLEKFIFIKKDLKISQIKVDLGNNFISGSYFKNNEMNFSLVDFNEKSKDFNKIKIKKFKYENN